MPPRRNRNYEVEESEEESEDEDYAPDEDESEEDNEQGETVPAESLVIEVLSFPATGEIETEIVGEDDDDEVQEVVRDTGRFVDRGIECKENIDSIDGQLPPELDPSCLPTCPICLLPWTPDGPHRVCCIPCGHVYGRSCLERWIKQCKKNASKCPQCNARFKMTEMINLYAPLVAVLNTDLEKEVLSLREKNESLIIERNCLMEEINKSKKMACLEAASVGALQRRSKHLDEGCISVTEHMFENRIISQNYSNTNCSSNERCVLQNEIAVDGARVLGIDASSRILIFSGKKPGHDGEHILSKISLLGLCEKDQIQLPPKTGAVRDLCILPGNLVLSASLGKKLLLLSLLSNNLVLKYDLPVPAWSCSGDSNEPYHIYAGLQNGSLLLFDIRQTARCLESIEGISRYPIHTICSLQKEHCSRKVITASSAGPCLWDVSGCGESPLLIPELEHQGVCISLACGTSSSDIVASFRPKIGLSNEATTPSQSQTQPLQSIYSAGKLGSHVHLKRINAKYFHKGHVTSCYVSEVRMSKSVIISNEGTSPLFACGDESTRGMRLWDLPSFRSHSHFRPHQCPILDVKFSGSANSGFIGCLSENKLQVFTC